MPVSFRGRPESLKWLINPYLILSLISSLISTYFLTCLLHPTSLASLLFMEYMKITVLWGFFYLLLPLSFLSVSHMVYCLTSFKSLPKFHLFIEAFSSIPSSKLHILIVIPMPIPFVFLFRIYCLLHYRTYFVGCSPPPIRKYAVRLQKSLSVLVLSISTVV